MPDRPIEYYNRYSQEVEKEEVYGGDFLKFGYGTKLGKLFVQILVKKPWFSLLYGKWMDVASSRKRIKPFIEKYGVNRGEFLEDTESFRTFNEFFYRKLKPEVRPIVKGTNVVTFPADGRHFGYQDVSKADRIFVKGQAFNIPELLGDKELGKAYENGTLILSRLCPVDYHRFHFPVSGRVLSVDLIKGPLYSVNPHALRRRLEILWENRRMRTVIETKEFGRVVMLEIGATCVGSIMQTFEDYKCVEKGAEKGYFQFGGSSTVLLFEPGRIKLDRDLVESSKRGQELYARMGDRIGERA